MYASREDQAEPVLRQACNALERHYDAWPSGGATSPGRSTLTASPPKHYRSCPRSLKTTRRRSDPQENSRSLRTVISRIH